MSDLNALTEAIIGAAIEVHQRLGPGLLETAYRKCLAYELRKRGFEVFASRFVRDGNAETLRTRSSCPRISSALSASPRFKILPTGGNR